MSATEPSPETAECRLSASLALLRISLGLFLLVWAVMKFVLPKGTINIFKKFYGLNIDVDLSLWIGIAQCVLAVAIIVGFARFWSYGAGLLVHAVSSLSSWKEVLDPWGMYLNTQPKMLFWAGAPVLAAFVLLWLVRERDLWSLDHWLGRST